MSGPKMTTIPPDGIEYWARLSAFINNNPVHERDRFYMAMLKPLGIEKGKEFKPDARQRAILEDAAKVGHLMARTLLFHAEERISNAIAFPGTRWAWVVLMDHDQETDTYSQLDERLHYFYGAIYMSPCHREKDGRPRRELHPGLRGQGRQPLRRRQVLPLALAREHTGVELLVAHTL